jgi:hypothetical protein
MEFYVGGRMSPRRLATVLRQLRERRDLTQEELPSEPDHAQPPVTDRGRAPQEPVSAGSQTLGPRPRRAGAEVAGVTTGSHARHRG